MNVVIFRILMFSCVAIGGFILYKMIRLLKKTFNGKLIVEIPFTEKKISFQLQAGNYAIWQKGQLFRRTPLDQFGFEIKNDSTAEPIRLRPTWFRVQSNGFEYGRTELNKFSAAKGNYTLEIVENQQPNKVLKLFTNVLPNKTVDLDRYYIQVCESQPVYYLLFAIPCLAVSGFVIIAGIVATIVGPQIAADFGINL